MNKIEEEGSGDNMRGSGLIKLEFTESNMGFHAADTGAGGGFIHCVWLWQLCTPKAGE